MLVPLELHGIVMRRGYLSPELALGWRIGTYAQEFFNGLENVRIAAHGDSDAALGLDLMIRKLDFPFPTTVVSEQRPWDLLFYHLITGTALQIRTVPELVELPPEVRRIESHLSNEDPKVAEKVIRLYRSAVDMLIKKILNEPIESFCRISEIRCRPLSLENENGPSEFCCRRCGRVQPKSKLVDADGVICCIPCAGLEPSWFEWI